MINISSVDKLEKKYEMAHPHWNKNAIHKQAVDFVNTCDKRLENVVESYITDGKRVDYSSGSFSIYMIQALRHNCDYLDAIILMNEYLLDPKKGKALIISR